MTADGPKIIAVRLRCMAAAHRAAQERYEQQGDGQSAEGSFHDAEMLDRAADLLAPKPLTVLIVGDPALRSPNEWKPKWALGGNVEAAP